MAQFYFIVHDNDGPPVDDEGLELPDTASARDQAIAGARSIMSDGILRGQLNLAGYIDIEDADRAHVGRVTFRSAVSIRD